LNDILVILGIVQENLICFLSLSYVNARRVFQFLGGKCSFLREIIYYINFPWWSCYYT